MNKKSKREYMRQYRAENKEKLRDGMRRWHEANKEGLRAKRAENRDERKAAARAWRLANPQRVTKYSWRTRLRRYGATEEQVIEMLLAQDGRCAICRHPVSFGARKRGDQANVDHCHESGAPRGILCNNCNRGLGMLGDDHAGIMRALRYLREIDTAGSSEGMLF